jgi:hypothetical protein
VRRALASLTLAAVVSSSQPALAQTAAPTPAPAAPAAVPDVVMKHDGSMLRGTIIEKVAGDYVEIQLGNGQTRRVPMSEVSYAGPASDAPSTKPAEAPPAAPPAAPPVAPRPDDGTRPLVTVRGEVANISIRSEGAEQYSLRRRSGAATVATGRGYAGIVAYDELCTSPCELTLPAGTYSFNVRPSGEESAADADPVTVPTGDSTLQIGYVNRGGLRKAGLVTLVGGASVGGLLVMVSALQRPEEKPDPSGVGTVQEERSYTGFYIGSGVLLASLLVGGLLILQSDRATIRVVPGVPSGVTPSPGSAPSRSVMLDPANTFANLQGLSFVGSF